MTAPADGVEKSGAVEVDPTALLTPTLLAVVPVDAVPGGVLPQPGLNDCTEKLLNLIPTFPTETCYSKFVIKLGQRWRWYRFD